MRAGVLEQGFGQFSETICGYAMGNDKDTMMSARFVVELKRKTDKVVAIARHDAALFLSSAFKLFEIRKPFGPCFVNADGVDSLAAQPFGNSLAQIFVEVIPQERAWVSDGCRSASFSLLQASLRKIWRSISSG